MEIVFWRVSFVSKAEIAKTPLIGSIGKSMQNIYVERDVEKSRKQTLEEITKRVESYESGQVLPLVLFPEGTTSNGRGMLKFKLGAFINKAPITVICLKYICN